MTLVACAVGHGCGIPHSHVQHNAVIDVVRPSPPRHHQVSTRAVLLRNVVLTRQSDLPCDALESRHSLENPSEEVPAGVVAGLKEPVVAVELVEHVQRLRGNERGSGAAAAVCGKSQRVVGHRVLQQ